MPTGASLTEATVSVKAVEVSRLPSETETVTVVVPHALATGVAVSVRLAPLPPKASPAAATSAVLLDVARTVSAPAGVWTSPTVKTIGALAVSSAVPALAIVLIVGALLASS